MRFCALITFFLLLFPVATLGQERPREDRSQEDRPPVAQEREPNIPAQRQVSPAQTRQNVQPVFTTLDGGAICATPGQALTLRGENLTASEIEPALKAPNARTSIPLRVISKDNARIVFQIPTDSLKADQSYRLGWIGKNNPQHFTASKISIRFCAPPVSATPATESAHTGEIVVYLNMNERSRFDAYLNAQDIEAAEQHQLGSLGGVIYVIKSSDPDVLETLRSTFPSFQVDWNSTIQGAQGPRLYAKDTINWPKDPACGKGDIDVRIGLLDGKIDLSHPAFSQSRIQQKSFIAQQQADTEHATFIGSLLVGKSPADKIDGLLPRAHLLNAVILYRDGQNNRMTTIDSFARGLDWLVENRVRLVNVSLAGKYDNRILRTIVDQAVNKGTLLFSAVGNNGPHAGATYPAAYPGVFAITAIDARHNIYKNANQGDFIDFSAPGVDIWAAKPEQGAHYDSGTSYAVPFAIAVSAQLLNHNPNINRELLRRLLERNAKDLGAEHIDTVYGHGVLRAIPCQ